MQLQFNSGNDTTVQERYATIVDMTLDLEGRLKAAMKRVEATVSSLHKVTGLSYQGIKKIYDGKTTTMEMATAEKLAKALGCNKFWLATGEGEPNYQEIKKVQSAEVAGAPSDDLARIGEARASIKASWPYPRVDLEKLRGLTGKQARQMENAIIAAAFDIEADILKEKEIAA